MYGSASSFDTHGSVGTLRLQPDGKFTEGSFRAKEHLGISTLKKKHR